MPQILAALVFLLLSSTLKAQGEYFGENPPGLEPRLFAPGIVSLDDRYEFGTTFSADGSEIYFGVAVEGRGEILSMRFEDGRWGDAEVVLSHPDHSYADPFLANDGQRLYFISSIPRDGEEADGTRDIWYLRRIPGGWSEPVNLGPAVNSAHEEFFVSFASDGTLAFASNRHDAGGTNFDIYLATRTGDGFAPPVPLPGRATTRAYEADPFISPNGDYILFSSTRRSGEGRRDLYATFRNDEGSWSRAVSLGPSINTPEIEFCPFVTHDGRYLFYTSNEDIYWVSAKVIDEARARLHSD